MFSLKNQLLQSHLKLVKIGVRFNAVNIPALQQQIFKKFLIIKSILY